jgi:hypothetical protein
MSEVWVGGTTNFQFEAVKSSFSLELTLTNIINRSSAGATVV